MQLYFLSFSSPSLFFLEVVVNVFDYFWKPNSLFSKFCVICLLMLYFVYCNNCVLNDVNGACWCTCSLVALRMSECVSDLRSLEKTLNFLRCIHVFDLLLKYGSDIIEGNWLQLQFFPAVFQVLDWIFLVLHFDGNVCNWIPKVIWPWMDWFWGFCWEIASFVDFVSV